MEYYHDEIFGLTPIFSEIYTAHDQPVMFSNENNMMTSDLTDPSSGSDSAISEFMSFENSTSAAPNNPNVGYSPPSNLEMVTPNIINFSPSVKDDDNFEIVEQYQDALNGQKRGFVANRTPAQAQEHLVAERQRRQKLGQLFISLSKVVPGLKKLDKASLLEDAIDHLKFLEERVSALEKENEKTSSNSVVHELNDSDDDDDGTTRELRDAPEINARIMNRTVLIRICCKKRNGLLPKIQYEMEKMHLNATDIRMMPFGSDALHIAIIAVMQNGFRGTVKGIVEYLGMVFLNPATDNMQTSLQ